MTVPDSPVPDSPVRIRPIRPSDYRTVIAVIDDWWGGRHMADMLPRLFFEHFTDTSFAAERDFDAARAGGCDRVRAVTSPVNRGSIAFHQRMGFDIEPGQAGPDGVPVAAGCDGDGQDRVRFVRDLGPSRVAGAG
jgi:hypothetical protein